ncbi:MAG: hypothetical protein KAI64_07520, partial [Thermoplasmata archaeon]|nr:hypothetical protein [Thermoplasmata archaeon]
LDTGKHWFFYYEPIQIYESVTIWYKAVDMVGNEGALETLDVMVREPVAPSSNPWWIVFVFETAAILLIIFHFFIKSKERKELEGAEEDREEANEEEGDTEEEETEEDEYEEEEEEEVD